MKKLDVTLIVLDAVIENGILKKKELYSTENFTIEYEVTFTDFVPKEQYEGSREIGGHYELEDIDIEIHNFYSNKPSMFENLAFSFDSEMFKEMYLEWWHKTVQLVDEFKR